MAIGSPEGVNVWQPQPQPSPVQHEHPTDHRTTRTLDTMRPPPAIWRNRLEYG
jgi:hypothetical protein